MSRHVLGVTKRTDLGANPVRTAWTIILILGILFQMGFLLREYILPWGWRAWQVRDQPRLIRSADMSLGAQAARIVRYVNQVVPRDATVLLPPGQDEARFSISRSMQYFFFPRTLVECGRLEAADCQTALTDPRVYVLASGDFPPKAMMAGRASVAPSRALGWFTGIYGPGFLSPGAAPTFDLADWAGSLVLDTAIVGGLWLLGLALLQAASRTWSALELIGLSVPVGAGVLAWALFMASWAGMRLSLVSAAGLYAGLLVIAVLLAVRRHGHSLQWSTGLDHLHNLGVLEWGLLAAGAVMLGLAVAISVGTSYQLYDPVQIWSVKGYGMAEAGNIMAGADWGVHGLAYPLNIPLQAALFFLVDGDALPGSKLLFPLYGLGLCLSVYAFLRRQHVEVRLAGLGALLLGSVPIVFFHASGGFANLPFTCYLIAGLLLGMDGAFSRSLDGQIVAGGLLGLAAWTRPEGVFYAAAGSVLILVAGRLASGTRARWVALLAPVLIFSGTWFAFSLGNRTLGGSNLQEAVTTFTTSLLAGHAQLAGLRTIVTTFTYSMFVPYLAMFPAVSATYWGALFPVVLVLMLWTARHLFAGDRLKSVLLYGLWVVVGGMTLGVFYIRSYSKPGFESFIERAFPRAFLPAAVLMLVIAVWGLGRLFFRSGNDAPRSQSRAADAD